MAQQQQNITLQAPAFQGINSEESPLIQDPTFCSRANNAVVDEYGRLGARKGYRSFVKSYDTSLFVPPSEANLEQTEVNTYSMVHADGSPPMVGLELHWKNSVGGDISTGYYWGLVNMANDTVKLLPIPTAHANLEMVKGQVVTFNGPNNTNYYVFSKDNPAYYVDPIGYTLGALSDDADFIPPQDGADANPNYLSGGDIDGDVCCAAYGRLWVTGVEGDYQRIYYSSLENPYWWYDGTVTPDESQNTGGIIDVSQYWPTGRDRITGIYAHNNMLVVFGRNSILLYGNPQGDPAAIGGIFLQDTISSLGLISRDAITATGNDLLFVDDTGVRSLGRSIQEQSVAVGDLTANVRGDVAYFILSASDISDISLTYWPQEGVTILNFPDNRKAFVLDMKRPSSTGGSRVTTWTEHVWNRSLHVEDGINDTVLLGAVDGSGLKEYRGNVDNVEDTYRFSYQSNPLTLGDSVRQKFPKRMDLTIVTKDSPCTAYARWGAATLDYIKKLDVDSQVPAVYGQVMFTGEIGELGGGVYGQSADTVKRYRVNTKGAGAVVTIGLDADINGGTFSLQEVNVQLLLGRIY